MASTDVDFSPGSPPPHDGLETTNDPPFHFRKCDICWHRSDVPLPTSIGDITNLEELLPRTEQNVFIYCYKVAKSRASFWHITFYFIEIFHQFRKSFFPIFVLPLLANIIIQHIMGDTTSTGGPSPINYASLSAVPAPGTVQTKVVLDGKIIASKPIQNAMPEPQKSNKKPTVTGANRGIGLGVAECCLDNGASKVYSIDFADPGDEFAAVSAKYPNRLFAVHADATKEPSIIAAVDKILEEAGALHGMVCNAGRTKHKAALDFTTEEIEQLFAINLFGAFYTARAAARAFIRQGIKGSVVFTASMASYRPNKVVPSAPYGATKAGVRNMTHTLAMEWAKYGIRVNSVSPGLVNTAMTYWVPQQPDWEQQLKYYGGIPRLAEVQELGGAYVYLLSDAASYTTSIDIPVNGVIGSKCFPFPSGCGFEIDADSLCSLLEWWWCGKIGDWTSCRLTMTIDFSLQTPF